MTEHERNETVARIAWRKGWLPEAFEEMSDEELKEFEERLDARS